MSTWLAVYLTGYAISIVEATRCGYAISIVDDCADTVIAALWPIFLLGDLVRITADWFERNEPK